MPPKSKLASKVKNRDAQALDFYRLLDDVPLGVLVMDRHRRVVFCNRFLETLIGMPALTTDGLHCRNVVRSRACISGCQAEHQTELSEAVCFQSDLINRDRKRVPVRLTLSSLYDVDGKPVGFLETVEDLRHLKAHDEEAAQAYSFSHIVGQSVQMRKLFGMLPVVAQSDASVLIIGETGTGKDMLAEALHQESARAKGPFVKINCGALPETLLESELFGHTKGAFTGAVENKQGRFHLAHNGTLYLTEIGDLPLPLQVKLLTFLDDKVVYPLGSTKGFAANVRVIAATHRDLEKMVREGKFRQDLFFRLNVMRLNISPLRDREGDVRLLVDYFLNYFTQKLHRNMSGFSVKAMQILLSYAYPGNVRELRNIVEYAVSVCREKKILAAHLPTYLSERRPMAMEPPTPSGPTVQRAGPAPVGREGVSTWTEMEKQLILDTLVHTRGNRLLAAKQLGWARSTLWRKMKQYGIDAS